VLGVEVVGGEDADTVAADLLVMDSRGLLRVSTRGHPPSGASVAGLVIAAPSALNVATAAELEAVADVILRDDVPTHEQVEHLYDLRIAPFASVLAGTPQPSSAVALQPYDPAWATAAGRYIHRLRAALGAVLVSPGTTCEHIGSTAVRGLSAKPILDLQIQLPELRHDAEFDEALTTVGFRPAEGSRPDSPGVYRDIPRGSDTGADHVWDKRLFLRPDPGQPAILHIRKAGSPWGRYTILFRDWLRDDPDERNRYQQTKTELARAHASDPDFDDYTRAKTVYFDGVQARLERYGREAGMRTTRQSGAPRKRRAPKPGTG
jgi:dephospho-CoA kinase